MLAELRGKSQVTIPKEVVTKLGIQEGDKLEVIEKDGIIQLIPVVVYPKKLVDVGHHDILNQYQCTCIRTRLRKTFLYANPDADAEGTPLPRTTIPILFISFPFEKNVL